MSTSTSITFFLNTRIPTSWIERSFQRFVTDYLTENNLGVFTGNGQMISSDRTEALAADFSVKLFQYDENTIKKLIHILEEAGAPIGSYWKFDDSDKRTYFGTLDALIVRFTDIPDSEAADFEKYIGDLIDCFSKDHSDTAGFQGLTFSNGKCVAAFHGFENEDMEKWLNELIIQSGAPYSWNIERTTARNPKN